MMGMVDFTLKFWTLRLMASNNGVYFAGLNKNEGYIDDFGCWQTYGWTDYFEKIFNTMNKDVKMKMFVGIGKSN